MKNFIKVLSVLLIVVLFSCSKEVPVFAIKRFDDKSYHKVTSNFEIASKEKILWSLVFKEVKKRKDFQIIVLADKLSWVDVFTQTDYIDIEKPALLGVISDLPPGDYKIMILDTKDNNNIMLSQEFLVYKENEDGFYD
jgi:hypothetical protein